MNIIHRYPIGTLLLQRRANARGFVIGQVCAYDNNYYRIDWHDWVPPHYTGIVSEPEVDRWVEAFQNWLARSI